MVRYKHSCIACVATDDYFCMVDGVGALTAFSPAYVLGVFSVFSCCCCFRNSGGMIYLNANVECFCLIKTPDNKRPRILALLVYFKAAFFN